MRLGLCISFCVLEFSVCDPGMAEEAVEAAGAEQPEPADAPAEKPKQTISAEKARGLIGQLSAEKIEDAIAAADELAEAGESALPYLLEACKTGDEAARRRVMGILGQVHCAAALNALHNALDDRSEAVRREAIYAVGEHGNAESVKKLETFLVNRNPLLRLEAAMALGRIGSSDDAGRKAAFPALRRSCLDDDRRVRKAAVLALGLMRERAAIPILITRLRDEDKMVRTIAHLFLKAMCDADFEYDPDDDLQWRDEAARKWETWWKANSKGDAGSGTGNEKEVNK